MAGKVENCGKKLPFKGSRAPEMWATFDTFKTCSLIHDGFISGQLTKGKQRKISQASAERQAISSYREEHLRLEF